MVGRALSIGTPKRIGVLGLEHWRSTFAGSGIRDLKKSTMKVHKDRWLQPREEEICRSRSHQNTSTCDI
jgi:hypothetical protein